MQTGLLISQNQDEFLSKSIKTEKSENNNLKAINSDDVSSRTDANFLSFFNDIAKENISDEKKPALKEKKEKELSGDYIESCIGKNERSDDEAIDKDLLLGFGSGLNAEDQEVESAGLTRHWLVSDNHQAQGPLNPLPGLEKTAPVSDGPFSENANVLKSGNEQTRKPPEGMMSSGEEETGRSVPQPAKGPLNPLPGLEKTAPVSVEADNEKDYVLRPESAMQKGAGGLDKGMINSGVKPLLSEEFFLESGLTEAKTNRFFDETKTEKKLDLNRKDLLLKLNSITQKLEDVTDNSSKNFANQDSNPNLASDLQNNKLSNTKTEIFGSDIFSNKIDKIESDKGADDLLSLNGQSSDKVSQGISTTKETSSLPKALETDVLSQIVKKAALNLKNGQTQVKIEIKPESLGHLRMQISTENHQVTAKIMAENPLVKEIIENNIHQLKTELQNHGLEIDKFDVDVFGSDVSDQNGAEYKNPSFLKMAGETDEDRMENSLPEVKEESLQVSEERRGTNAIDFFA